MDMSDDWVQNYIQDRSNKQRKTQMAVAGAPGLFQKIQDRIRKDIQAFHDAGVFLHLRIGQGGRTGTCTVASDTSPTVALRMTLDVVRIECGYLLENDGSPRPQHETLKVCSDLGGTLRVYRDGEELADESNVFAVSEYLLRPLLKHIDS